MYSEASTGSFDQLLAWVKVGVQKVIERRVNDLNTQAHSEGGVLARIQCGNGDDH